MAKRTTFFRNQVLAEVDTVPDEYLPFILEMIRSFHDNVLLKPAETSFKRGWEEARQGETYPASTLWDNLE